MPKLSDEVVMHAIVTRLIPPAARRAIVACATWGYGDARNLAGHGSRSEGGKEIPSGKPIV